VAIIFYQDVSEDNMEICGSMLEKHTKLDQVTLPIVQYLSYNA
jgi:hypothetical protein